MYRAVVADNDGHTLDFFQQLLSEGDMDFTGVSSGHELFAGITIAGAPNILITEAHLPDISISDLLRILKTKCPNTLIVVVTRDGSKETSERVRMQETPIFYFALKPLSEEEMRHVLQDAASVLREAKVAAK